MAADNRSKFIVDLAGNVVERARRFGSSIRRMGADGSRSMRLFQGATQQVNGMLDKFDNKLMGFVAGGGLVMMGKRVGDQQQQLVDLGNRYNMTADQMKAVDDLMWKTSANRKLPYADVMAAVDQFLEKTNSPDALIENMDNLALAIKGIGLEASTAGKYTGTLWNKGVKDAQEMRKAYDGFASLSSIGTGNLNEQLDGLINLTHGTSWQKPDQLYQLLAMQRLGDAEFGSSGQSAAALQQMHDALKDPEKRRVLERNGVKVWGDKSKGEFVSPGDLMLDIGDRSKYKERNLSQVFSGDMLKLAQSFNDKDKQQQLRAPDTTEGLVSEKATRSVQTFNGALTSLTNAGERWANLNLSGPIQGLADAINDLSPEELERYAEIVKNIALGIGGVVAARKLYRGGMAVRDWWKGGAAGGGPGGGGGGAGGGLLGAQRVFVTNWPVGGLGGGGSKGSAVVGGGGGMLAKAGFAGAISAVVTPYVDDALVSVFGDAKTFNRIRSAPTWSEFGAALMDGVSDAVNSVTDPLIGDTEFVNWAKNTTLGDVWDGIFGNADSASIAPELLSPPMQPPPEGEIKLKIELPEGATVRSTQVQSTGVGISVNTGNTYLGGY